MKKQAPKGVGWGTTNTPVNKRIEPSANTYKTRNGRPILGLEIVLHNSANREVTFPVKGSIDRGKNREPRYQIWTLDGRANLFGDSKDDLVQQG